MRTAAARRRDGSEWLGGWISQRTERAADRRRAYLAATAPAAGPGDALDADVETAPDKPIFRSAFRKRRCLLPASGFYEWQATPGAKKKQPYAIRLADDKPFAFAGLWEKRAGPDGDVESCCILTTAPNDLAANIHNRMPVILDPQYYDHWLDPKEQDAASLAPLLQRFPAEKMQAYPVSIWVNDVKHKDARCLEPA